MRKTEYEVPVGEKRIVVTGYEYNEFFAVNRDPVVPSVWNLTFWPLGHAILLGAPSRQQALEGADAIWRISTIRFWDDVEATGSIAPGRETVLLRMALDKIQNLWEDGAPIDADDFRREEWLDRVRFEEREKVPERLRWRPGAEGI